MIDEDGDSEDDLDEPRKRRKCNLEEQNDIQLDGATVRPLDRFASGIQGRGRYANGHTERVLALARNAETLHIFLYRNIRNIHYLAGNSIAQLSKDDGKIFGIDASDDVYQDTAALHFMEAGSTRKICRVVQRRMKSTAQFFRIFKLRLYIVNEMPFNSPYNSIAEKDAEEQREILELRAIQEEMIQTP